jgi:hypothetical protein
MSKNFENLAIAGTGFSLFHKDTPNVLPYHNISTKEDYLTWLKKWKKHYAALTLAIKHYKVARKRDYWAVMDTKGGSFDYHLKVYMKELPDKAYADIVPRLQNWSAYQAKVYAGKATQMLLLRKNYKYASAFLRNKSKNV